jgi:hypothetical protein
MAMDEHWERHWEPQKDWESWAKARESVSAKATVTEKDAASDWGSDAAKEWATDAVSA